MRALEREVVDAVFAAIEPLLPEPPVHPLGCHRPRVPDRLCFWGTLIRLTTGASWVDIEAILEHRVSDTTLRARRDEWIAASVFDELRDEATRAFDRIIGMDLSEVAIDGSLHKAPYGGEGTGANPTDRGKHGWKWSIGVDRHGIPLGWSIDGANRNDVRMLMPTLDAITADGWTAEIETIHLDRGYDYPKIRRQLLDVTGAARTRFDELLVEFGDPGQVADLIARATADVDAILAADRALDAFHGKEILRTFLVSHCRGLSLSPRIFEYELAHRASNAERTKRLTGEAVERIRHYVPSGLVPSLEHGVAALADGADRNAAEEVLSRARDARARWERGEPAERSGQETLRADAFTVAHRLAEVGHRDLEAALMAAAVEIGTT